jgi:hypothetical protein
MSPKALSLALRACPTIAGAKLMSDLFGNKGASANSVLSGLSDLFWSQAVISNRYRGRLMSNCYPACDEVRV